MANVSKFSTCIFLNNQPCKIRPTLINFNSGEYNQGLSYCPFIVNLDRCNGSCNSLDDLSNRNKWKIWIVCVFNMITQINESKTLTKHIWFKYKV